MIVAPSPRTARPLLAADARRHHRSLLLRELYWGAPQSRADLARATGLTRATVGSVVGELLTDGLVEEIGAPDEARVGKPPVIVEFARGAIRMVCVDLTSSVWNAGVVDAAGEVVGRRTLAVDPESGADLVAVLESLVDEMLAAAGPGVVGIGVGTPGVVDAAGVVVEAPNLGWYGVPLAQRLAERTALPVHVGNDANVAALGERVFGDKAASELMLVRVGRGVGAGLLIDGRLLQGSRFAAGEIGHVVVDPEGDLCACGRWGCLETVLGEPALRARLIEGDPLQVLAEAGRRLGTSLAPVVAALNLKELVLSGPADLLDGVLREAVEDAIRDATLTEVGAELVVRMSAVNDAVLLGSAALVLAGELEVL